MRLATQVLLLQVAVVVLTLGIAGGLLAFLSHQRIHAEVGQRALDVARVLAFAPAVRADVARYDDTGLPKGPAATDELANGQLQLIASEVQKRTDVLFVVFTNDQGIRLAHPNSDELGKPVSTDPDRGTRGTRDGGGTVRHPGTVGARQSAYPATEFASKWSVRSASESRHRRCTSSCGPMSGRRRCWSEWRC